MENSSLSFSEELKRQQPYLPPNEVPSPTSMCSGDSNVPMRWRPTRGLWALWIISAQLRQKPRVKELCLECFMVFPKMVLLLVQAEEAPACAPASSAPSASLWRPWGSQAWDLQVVRELSPTGGFALTWFVNAQSDEGSSGCAHQGEQQHGEVSGTKYFLSSGTSKLRQWLLKDSLFHCFVGYMRHSGMDLIYILMITILT